MPSFDDRSGNMVRPLLDLKQITPSVETGSDAAYTGISAPVRARQDPHTSALSSSGSTRQFIAIPSSTTTHQLVATSLSSATDQLILKSASDPTSGVAPGAVESSAPRVTHQLTPDTTHQSVAAPTPRVTRQLTAVFPSVTRQPGAPLTDLANQDTQRAPLVIKGEMKKLVLVPAKIPPAERHKRLRAINLIGMGFLLLVIFLTALTATPLGREVGLDWQSGSSLFHNPAHGPDSLVAQATATAIYHQRSDGYDPFARGSLLVGDGLHSLGWPVGQCTYWANLRYHELTGNWVPWKGNADQWVAGAKLAHWNISQSPHVPSIIVLMPGVQTASGYGHVAVVEGINANGTVRTSNMNWYSNGGGFDTESTADFTPGPGVYFIWHS